MANVQSAFLLGVFVGQWLMLSAFYLATLRLLKEMVSSLNAMQTSEPPSNELLCFPTDESSEED